MAKSHEALVGEGTYQEIKAAVEALPNRDQLIAEANRKLQAGETLTTDEKLVILYLQGRTSGGRISESVRERIMRDEPAESPTPATVRAVESQVTDTGLYRQFDASGRPIAEHQYVPEFDSFIDVTPPAAPGDDPAYLGGMPPGTTFPRSEILGPAHPEFGVPRQAGPPIEPAYLAGQEWAQFAGKDPVYVNQIQLTLWQAGLLNKDEMTPGWWGPAETEAMKALMTMANRATTNAGRQVSWQEIAAARIAGGARQREESDRRPFIQEPYIKPDYEELESAVRRAFSAQIGRQPEDWEIGVFADKLNQDFRARYEAETAANRAYHEAGNRALTEDADQTSGEFQDVDPLSRLTNAIYERYGRVLEEREEAQGRAVYVDRLMRNLAGAERAVGGR